jgi:dihydroorotase
MLSATTKRATRRAGPHDLWEHRDGLMDNDWIIRGGTVLDPGSGLDGPADVAVRNGEIVEIGPDLPAHEAAPTIDATGLLVLPGLIDLHTHVFRGATFWGIDPDPVAVRSGVTTWVDAGSAGAIGLSGLREFVAERARVRVLAFVHISAIGLVSVDYESERLEHCDVAVCCRAVERNRDFVVGVKVRMGSLTVGANGCEPLRLARQAADTFGLPVMVHVGIGPPDLTEVLDELRPGDIVTHCCTGQSMSLVGRENRVSDAARRARDQGVIFDVGHGAGSFSFRTAELMLAEGFAPDVISSDIHHLSRYGNGLSEANDGLTYYVRRESRDALDLPSCMTKLLHLGMPLADVVSAVTERPARVLGRYPEIGALRVGGAADLCLLRLEEGQFDSFDTHGECRRATRAFRAAVTLRNGRVLAEDPTSFDEVPPWVQFW